MAAPDPPSPARRHPGPASPPPSSNLSFGRLLAQFDSDSDSDSDARMTWGGEGTLYWLIRPEDLAAHRFDQARLTVQC
ncbi:DUF1963 domain-containing protein [Streptomyces sp. NPDC048277]|uniref:DUF1963 domain-containing protein n=1 Tax=Streptomyces sp. NPDC048277 TaxID=3155027 RepID=UPI0033F8E6BF